MNDESMRDMVPKDDRSIRNINLNREDGASSEEVPVRREREAYEPPRRRDRSSRFSTWWMWALGVVILVFIILSLTPFLTRASVEITPRHQAVEISGSFTAAPVGSTNSEADLFYDLMTIELTEETEVEASGEEEVSERAAGRITVYNEFSSEPERLIANTRFEAENGLIFRISNPIVIPGYTESGGEITPGTIEVSVTADEAGEKYNIGATRFSVPGLQGDDRFDKIYARSQNAMTGGFIGVKRVASEEDVEEARENLQTSLQENAEEQISEEIPDDFVFFSEAAEVSFESLPTEDSPEGGVIVTERMLTSVPIFNRTDIAEFIATQTIGSYEGEEVKILDPESLSVTLASTEGDVLELALEGSPVIVWVVDLEELKDDLLGLEREEVEEVLGNYSSIEAADINLSPFWKRTLPEEEEKLSVEEVIPE